MDVHCSRAVPKKISFCFVYDVFRVVSSTLLFVSQHTEDGKSRDKLYKIYKTVIFFVDYFELKVQIFH